MNSGGSLIPVKCTLVSNMIAKTENVTKELSPLQFQFTFMICNCKMDQSSKCHQQNFD